LPSGHPPPLADRRRCLPRPQAQQSPQARQSPQEQWRRALDQQPGRGDSHASWASGLGPAPATSPPSASRGKPSSGGRLQAQARGKEAGDAWRTVVHHHHAAAAAASAATTTPPHRGARRPQPAADLNIFDTLEGADTESVSSRASAASSSTSSSSSRRRRGGRGAGAAAAAAAAAAATAALAGLDLHAGCNRSGSGRASPTSQLATSQLATSPAPAPRRAVKPLEMWAAAPAEAEAVAHEAKGVQDAMARCAVGCWLRCAGELAPLLVP
jgi:hypothetical protein